MRVMAAVVLAVLAIALTWAVGSKVDHTTPGKEELQEVWTAVDTDPWAEFNTIISRMHDAMPFVQDGKVVLKDSKDSLVETKDFHIGYFDSLTMCYQIDQVEMVQTKNWQAMIDHERNVLAINGIVKPDASMNQMVFDIAGMKKIFSDNKFTFRVLQNGQGKRMLSSDNFTSGTFSGLQIRYDGSSHSIISVTMGIPRIVAKTEEEDQKDTAKNGLGINVVSESLQLQYEPVQPEKINSVANPNSYFVVKDKRLIVLDKRFDAYRIINHIK